VHVLDVRTAANHVLLEITALEIMAKNHFKTKATILSFLKSR